MSDGLGAYIKRRREELGMTARDLAERSELSKSHLSQIEVGKIGLPNADIRRRLARALGVSHLNLLIAAGEITNAEIVKVGATSVPIDGPLESKLIALIRGINWEPDQAAFAEQVLRQMFSERAKR